MTLQGGDRLIINLNVVSSYQASDRSLRFRHPYQSADLHAILTGAPACGAWTGRWTAEVERAWAPLIVTFTRNCAARMNDDFSESSKDNRRMLFLKGKILTLYKSLLYTRTPEEEVAARKKVRSLDRLTGEDLDVDEDGVPFEPTENVLA